MIQHLIFLVGYGTAFWGAFEMAYQSGSHAIWSGTWGFPFPHHYVVGFMLVGLSYFMFTMDDYISKIIIDDLERQVKDMSTGMVYEEESD